MTMPKAQFKPILQVQSGTASVSGPLTHDERQSRVSGPQFVHWVLAQGDEVSAGLAQFAAGDSEWRSQDSEPHEWTAGTAQAAGAIFTIKAEQTGPEPIPAVVETFTWSQQVTLDVS
jgi:hypothetical protein